MRKKGDRPNAAPCTTATPSSSSSAIRGTVVVHGNVAAATHGETVLKNAQPLVVEYAGGDKLFLPVTRLAQLGKFIDTLPGGYDHMVGERGIRLSGGQRQRIGIARALYRDASVLLMDEATSAQDGLTEQELMTTILRLRGRYTIILIAHRLSSVRACDVIFEFAGRLPESGRGASLCCRSCIAAIP